MVIILSKTFTNLLIKSSFNWISTNNEYLSIKLGALERAKLELFNDDGST
jgi:hypothetical protein